MHARHHRNSAAESAPAWVQMALFDIFLGLGGLVFCALSTMYVIDMLDDFRGDHFEFAIGSSWGTTWHRTYSVTDHPLLFALRIVLDATGAVGALLIGLVIFGAMISINIKTAGPVIKKMAALGKPCLITGLITFGAHFGFVAVLYLVALIDRS